MALLSKIIAFLKELDEKIQLSKMSFESEDYRGYTLKKYHKKKCPNCNGVGYLDD